jgi:hypothetical protein
MPNPSCWPVRLSALIAYAEADKLISAANSDPQKLAASLGLPPSALKDASPLRIDIQSPQNAGLRMPSGNEAGANSMWIPGGKLPDGSSEAVINASKVAPYMLKVTKIGG